MEHYGKVARLTKTHAAADNEAVTIADRAVQRIIVSQLRGLFPTDGIVGEESDLGDGITFDVADPAGRVWVIDPIDGTNNFIGRQGNFCVSIGLLEAGEPILGVVFDVTRNSMLAAARGLGSTHDGAAARTLPGGLDAASMIYLTSSLLIGGRLPGWVVPLMSQNTWKIRILGSAALELGLVGAGIGNAAIQVQCKLWDVAAAGAVLLCGGGVLTDLGGKPIFPFNLSSYSGAKVPFLAAGSIEAHSTLIQLMRDHP